MSEQSESEVMGRSIENMSLSSILGHSAGTGPNRLIIIGGIGQYTAYLNVSRDEAISHFLKHWNMESLDGNIVEEFQFSTCFEVYDAWPVAEQDELFSQKDEGAGV